MRLKPLVCVCAVAAVVAVASTARGQQVRSENGSTHVRAGDKKAAVLLEAGLSASPTFRRIVDILEESDLVVYIETRPMTRPSHLQLAAVAGGRRYVRISVRLPGRDADLVAWLGHELQHAAELAAAREVVDENSLVRLYERIGGVRRATGTMETRRAQEIWKKILDETRYGR